MKVELMGFSYNLYPSCKTTTNNFRINDMKRLIIERLELDLHGVTPHAAETATRLLGPALVRALAGRRIEATSTVRMDAGRIGLTGEPEAGNVAAQIARRIADRTTGG
jgi:hypothetical protein